MTVKLSYFTERVVYSFSKKLSEKKSRNWILLISQHIYFLMEKPVRTFQKILQRTNPKSLIIHPLKNPLERNKWYSISSRVNLKNIIACT